MPLMGAFYVGVSGLQTSQNALNTTAHNLANIDTTGYTRQQVYQGDRRSESIGQNYNNNLQVGMGVAYSDVRAVRDFFMDRQYRTDAGRAAYYTTSYEAIQEISSLFGETEGIQFQASLQNLRDIMMDLANNPTDPTIQGEVVSRSQQFLSHAKSIYGGLVQYQGNLNQQIKDQVDKINEYAEQIAVLNEKISVVEAGKQESANDLRDARDQILDELAAMGRISYKEDLHGMVGVQFEGVDLVKDAHVNKMEAKILEGDEESGFYTPVWGSYNDQPVFEGVSYILNSSKTAVETVANPEISSQMDTDLGSLKALVMTRGTKNATYKDLKEVDASSPGAPEINGTRYALTAGQNFERVSGSSITMVMAEFDNLVNGIITGVNKLVAEDEAGNRKAKLDDNGLPVSGEYTPYLFTEVITDKGIGFTTANAQINKELLRQPTLLNNGFVLSDQSTDFDTANAIKDLFLNDFETLNPETKTPLNFEEYYIDIVDQYANFGYGYKNASEAQEAALLATESARQQVMGVSDNEELTKMVRYQNAYNASSRYFNTVNTMLDQLLSMI